MDFGYYPSWLANLYTVRDHMAVGMQKVEPAVSISEVIALDDNSEFAQAVNGKSTKTVMGTVEELMETLRAINPRLYESVIRQLTE